MLPAPSSQAAELHLYAEQAFTGWSDEIEHDVLIRIVGGTIADVVPRPRSLPPGTSRHRFLLPGLIDAHVHLAFPAGGPLGAPEEDGDRLLAHALSVLERLLACGVTTVRDLGCPEAVFRQLRAAVGEHPGRYPRMVGSGPPITSPGGHLAALGIEVATVREAGAAVARCLAAGSDVIKVVVTGGRMTPGSPMGRLTFGQPLLGAVVVEAHRSGVPVAAHVHGIEGIEAAVHAGVDTLEHCSWTDEVGRVRRPVGRVLAEMQARNQVVVTAGPLAPSLVVRAAGPASTRRPDPDRRTRRQLALWRNARSALERGVHVAIGTDSMFGAVRGTRDLVTRALLMSELAGWGVGEALRAMTETGALACGAARGVGVLARGAAADIVTLDANPLEHPRALLRSRCLVYRGQLQAGAVDREREEVPA